MFFHTLFIINMLLHIILSDVTSRSRSLGSSILGLYVFLSYLTFFGYMVLEIPFDNYLGNFIHVYGDCIV